MCAPETQNTAAQLLHSHLAYINWVVKYLYEAFFFMCEQIFSPGSNANYESVSAEQPDSLWLNLLMSRLPLIRNQLLIQIHTLFL